MAPRPPTVSFLSPAPAPVPWRQREFVGLREAGEIAGRSFEWIVDRIADGTIEARRDWSRDLRLGVAVASLRRLVDGAEPVRDAKPARTDRPRLRLVISNP